MIIPLIPKDYFGLVSTNLRLTYSTFGHAMSLTSFRKPSQGDQQPSMQLAHWKRDGIGQDESHHCLRSWASGSSWVHGLKDARASLDWWSSLLSHRCRLKETRTLNVWKLNDKPKQGIFETGDHNCAQRESANLKIDNNSSYLIGTTQYSFYLACNDSQSKNTGKQQ